jgi:pimeloyl-ACP methyl ester carboxylesterase
MKMNRRYLYTFALAGLLLAGCGGSTSDNYSESEAPGGYVLFSSDTGNIPYPNDILIDPTTGKINFDTSPEDSDYAVKSALNTLDGFSTTAPVTVGVSDEVDTATLKDNVLLIDTTAGPLVYDQDYVASYQNGKIAILPLHPFKSSNRYIVVLRKGIKATNGREIEPDYPTSLILGTKPLIDAEGNPTVVLSKDPQENLVKATKLEAIRQHTQTLIAASRLPAESILDIWSFKTQTIGKVARAIAQHNTQDAVLQLQDIHTTSKDLLVNYYNAIGETEKAAELNATMAGNAEVYVGVLANLPYYLGIPTDTNPLAPLTESFQFAGDNPMPIERKRLTIPVLASVPGTASGCTEPLEGWPVAIFQHGITRNRLDVLAISEALARICYAVVGIDLPLHGIADPNNPLYDKAHERTFNLDFLTQDKDEHILAKRPDGIPDSSGIHYINFTSLLTARDNVRQSTSDYIALQNAIAATQKDVNGVAFDGNKVAYVGHSLGTIAPFGYFSYMDEASLSLTTAMLSMPGGGITDIMIHSLTFGPAIVNGLKEAGLEPGSPSFYAFLNAFQTVLDDADPLNYASLAAKKQKFLMHMVKDDDVIPNTIPTAPMSGGVPIVKLMDGKDITTYFLPGETEKTVTPVPGEDVYTFFLKGNHRSLFIPDYNPLTTIEMQTEMDSFISSEGTAIQADLTRINQ